MASAGWIRHEYRNLDELTSNVYRDLYVMRCVSSSTCPVVRDQALAEFNELLGTELAVYNRDVMEEASKALIDELQELRALLDVRGELLARTGGGLPDHKTRKRWTVDGDITTALERTPQ